jgi:antirestriction protein ArdC
MAKTKMTEQERRAYREEKVASAMDALGQGVRDVIEGGEWREMLVTMSRFHRYSWRNCLLIHQQMPEATAVAGYGDWRRKFNRQVRKGETGIDILAPIVRKVEDEGDSDGNGEPKRKGRIVGVKTVRVFDVSQTDGEELPTVCHELTGEVDGYGGLISALVEASPCPVAFAHVGGEAHGFYSHDTRSITVDDGMAEEQTVKTLVHEIAHATLHAMPCKPADLHGDELAGYVAAQGAREVEAESVAFVVSDWLGIDSSDYSFGYVAAWADGDEDKVKESLEAIRKGSKAIIDSLEAQLADGDPAEAVRAA